ncbi:MAG: methyltransferase [Nocardioidaceae bacterium]
MAEHYFADDPSSPLERLCVEVPAWGRSLPLQSASGVFAHGRLDRGTAVLLRSTRPPEMAGTFLDLGCGYGPIACALAVAVPGSDVWAVDVNRRALQLTGENSQRLGIGERVHACTPEEVPAELNFDEIWSNPPIRVGKQALHALLSRWLPRLRTSGRAVLVVGKNLGSDSLQRWFGEEGYRCERLASAKGFRVLEVRR